WSSDVCSSDLTIVAFVFCVNDALYRRATVRARLAIPSVNGHFGPECGNFRWEIRSSLRSKALDPFFKRGFHRFVEPTYFVLRKFRCELHRRQARAVKDLVGIRVADSAEAAEVRAS